MGDEVKAAWVPCCCGNHWCTIHDMHAYECDCPPIEEWGHSPYEAMSEQRDLKARLQYIIDSPGQEHGGFHPQVVETARAALARVQELEAEKTHRIYYQSIVYDVCNLLDKLDGRRPGRGLVCGTVDTPTRQVQDRVKEVAARLEQQEALLGRWMVSFCKGYVVLDSLLPLRRDTAALLGGSSMKAFPIQSQRGAAPHPLSIPWEIAELAYSVYSAQYGRGQSLERLAERGGFGPGEMDTLLPGWRDMCSRLARQEALLVRWMDVRSHLSTLDEAIEVRRDTAALLGDQR